MTPKTEVKCGEIFTETHPLRVKIDAEHAGAIIFKPKSSKTYEFSQFLNKTRVGLYKIIELSCVKIIIEKSVKIHMFSQILV